MFVALLGCVSAADSKSSFVSMGNDTYAITRQAGSAFHRDVDALKAEAQEDAATYCATHGKVLKVLSVTVVKPHFSLGYAKARIVFKALDAGDPELTRPVGAAVPVTPAERVLTTGDVYNDLLKLDDLRKRGILTEEEFQSEKKKVLSHSQ